MSLISGFSRWLFGSNNYYLSMIGDKGEQWVSVTGMESELYNEIPQLKSVIDRRSSMLSNGRWKIIKDGIEQEDNDLIKFLNKPNPLQDGSEFITNLETQLCIYGNSFSYKNKALRVSEVPSTLICLPSKYLKINKTGKIYKQTELKGIIKNYKLVYPNKAEEEIYDTEDILHINFPNPDDPILGLSPLMSLKMPLSNIKGAYQYRNTILYKKGAIGILSAAKSDATGAIPLLKHERERIEKQYHKDYGTESNKQSVMIAEQAMNWTPMTYPTKDLLLFEEIDANMMTIIDAYGMDVNLFSSQKGTTFSNLLEGIKNCYESTIIPHAKSIATNLGAFLEIADNEELVLDYSHIPVLQKDESKAAEILQKKSDAYSKFKASGMSEEDLKLLFPIDELIAYL